MSGTTLIVVDMLNPYEHEDAELLVKSVAEIVDPLRELIMRARTHDDVSLIFVNDNHGDFSATREDLVARAKSGKRPDLIEPILPPSDCAFLVKVRHSAFYSTTLDYLLSRSGVEKVILTGQVTELGASALRMMERNMHAEITTTSRCLTRS